MDQLDPDLVQRVNTKVSAVVERYLLDDQDLTPKNTRKAYGPKQAEWMIASRAPKRGKRRKAETQRLKTEGKQKRRKRESPSPTGAADVIVVGGGPAKDPDLKSEPDLDNMDPDPDSAIGTSTLKLQYSTVRLYSSAIINLYAQQKTRGENPAPHPNGLAKKALMRHILRETACRSRNEWADRILNTIKDGYSPAKIPEHTAAAWRFSDVNSGFRTNLFSMRKVVMDEVVRLACARGWPEEDAVHELEKQRVEGGNLSLNALAKQLKAAQKS
ncbi:hypothetical protein N658DRAFT_556904 [Parathielavia hyrcaniae]|uniref:Uncharacterized protein n=1 Tax=Parathielavia hyrcaniae TaxID=113614 RepID=A0AAN6Q5C0_9PEZI|nr:hypothetical protein N658DRAFT_556904 [Parathielavia hyrcaniae]